MAEKLELPEVRVHYLTKISEKGRRRIKFSRHACNGEITLPFRLLKGENGEEDRYVVRIPKNKPHWCDYGGQSIIVKPF